MAPPLLGSSGTYLPVKGALPWLLSRSHKATRIYPGTDAPAVDKLDLEIADGEFLVLVGPSGCGKSTSLRMLAGLEEVNDGGILIGDRDVTQPPAEGPRHRDGLPELRALPAHDGRREHGLRAQDRRRPKAEIAGAVDEAAKLLDLEEYLDRKPKALSGGQRQRVAMGRAIVRQPQVFLMDEPLSNLDAKLRVQTRTQIASLQRRLGVTTVYVTHDQVEAMTMGDRVAVLKDGLLQQVDTPARLYDTPNNVFVAGFIGSPAMNLLDGEVVGEEARGRRARRSRWPASVRERLGGDRPSPSASVPRTPGRRRRQPGLTVRVDLVEELGADGYLYSCPTATPTPKRSRSSRASTPVADPSRARTSTSRPTRQVHVFAGSTGDRVTD